MTTTATVPIQRASLVPREDELLALLREATLGEYEVLGELGRGGMATVFLAMDIALERRVAIKVMSPLLLYGDGMAERFKREARTAGGLSHPHIIPIHAVRETGQLLYFVMKFVDGRSIDQLLKDFGPFAPDMVQAILAQVGSALHHAHRRQIVHRDVKPANIMLDEEGWAVVTDFGIAKVESQTELTRTGSAVGTPYYMSPEQCNGRGVGPASDQYSLGVVAYEMLTGRVPFPGPTIMDVMRAHFMEAPPPLQGLCPGCPPAIAQVVMRMLAKDPAARFPSTEDAIKALGAPPLEVNDPLRTQMVELARSGPRFRPPQISVPISPVRLQRMPEARAKRSSRVEAAAPPRPPGPRRWLLGTLAVAGILGAGYLGRAYLPVARPSPASPVASEPSLIPSRLGDTTARATPDAITAPDTVASPGVETPGTTPAPEPIPPAPVPVAPRTASSPAGTGTTALRRSTATPGLPTGSPADTSPRVASPAPVRPPVPDSASARDSASRTAAPPRPAVITVWSRRPGVRLYVNSNDLGILPLEPQSFVVAPGLVSLRVMADGCEASDRQVTVKPGDTVMVGRMTPICN